MESRWARDHADVEQAIAVDEKLIGDRARSGYIVSVAESGGLAIAAYEREARAFCCLDHRCFFERPFVSLLIVDPPARRFGVGAQLLSFTIDGLGDVWTSTNRSNAPMRALLAKHGWSFCGEINGLDDGDPELFFRKTG